jgi:general secretion pathway protein G
MKKAFTMVELVFAIVIIGILASIAIPKLAVTRDDAEIVRARTTVSALRSALATERQKRVLSGNFDAIASTEVLGLLAYGDSITSQGWAEPTQDNAYFVFTGPGDETCSFAIENNKFMKKTCTIHGMSDL